MVKDKKDEKTELQDKKSESILKKNPLSKGVVKAKGFISRKRKLEGIHFVIFMKSKRAHVALIDGKTYDYKGSTYSATTNEIALFGNNAFIFFNEEGSAPINIYERDNTVIAQEVFNLLHNESFTLWNNAQQNKDMMNVLKEILKYLTYIGIGVAVSIVFSYRASSTLSNVVNALSKVPGLEALLNV